MSASGDGRGQHHATRIRVDVDEGAKERRRFDAGVQNVKIMALCRAHGGEEGKVYGSIEGNAHPSRVQHALRRVLRRVEVPGSHGLIQQRPTRRALVDAHDAIGTRFEGVEGARCAIVGIAAVFIVSERCTRRTRGRVTAYG